jgi:hypothetical protein
MPSINFNDEDYDFLAAQAEKDGISLEEYLSNMVDRQRVIVKYPAKSAPIDTKPTSNMEPPHRKWGM